MLHTHPARAGGGHEITGSGNLVCVFASRSLPAVSATLPTGSGHRRSTFLL
jgi:hypothetical protein